MKTNTLSNRRLNILLHAIVWIIAIIIPLYLTKEFDNGNERRLYQFYIHTLSAIIIFYVGYLWLVPRFFMRDRKTLYILILAAVIVFNYAVINYLLEHWIADPMQEERLRHAMEGAFDKQALQKPPVKALGFYFHIVSSFLISGFAVGLGVLEKLKENEKKQKELEREKLNSELAFLKNQISPHFFFNTLNNIYSLIGTNTKMAQDSVLKLSKLMRYLLYESEHGETHISRELEFMTNYIDLMKLRLSPRVELKVDFPEQYSDCLVPPLLFVPFVENAFKHGVSYRDHSYITIKMTISDQMIHFVSENSIGKGSKTEDLQHSGIGLENVTKRLALLFPGKHQMKVESNDSFFLVDLFITITEKV